MTTASCILFYALLPAIVLLAVALWATETRQERVRRWRKEGMSQQAIADRLGVSRWQVRRILGVA